MLIEIFYVNNPRHNYEIKINDDSVIHIYCDVKYFKLLHKRRWIRDKKIFIYNVYSILTNSDNQTLEKSFHNRELHISNLTNGYESPEDAKRKAIKAFLDLIYTELNRDVGEHS